MTMGFHVILVLIHWIISLKETVIFICFWLSKLGHLGKDPRSVTAIRNDVAHLRRLPVHLGIVVVEDDLNIVDIAKIVVWAVAAGISYITIYDHKGHCKKNKEVVLRKLEELSKRLEVSSHHQESSTSKQYTSIPECTPEDTYMSLNGVCHRQNPSIQFVGPEDGRQHLIRITKQLSRQVANHEITSDCINVPFVNDAVHGKNSFPDPDLVMKFGAVNSLFGFLPWHIRLSEILSLPTHRNIDFSSFFAALDQFGHTQQRNGK